MESVTAVGESPVYEMQEALWRILSTAGHVKPCRNQRGPSRKAKYSLVTDSEQVPWGKGEKHPYKGSEREPETECLQAVGGASGPDGVPFV